MHETISSLADNAYSFPMDVVFRIFDNVFASGIEALFSFSLVLLLKNEEDLLNNKFDQLIKFLNARIFDTYRVMGCFFPSAVVVDMLA